MKVYNLYLFTFFTLLCSCGGGGGDSTDTVEPDSILPNMKVTNIDESGFPWYGIAVGKLKRWDYTADGLIPVKTNGIALANQAMNSIEKELGLIIFDRASIENIPSDNITRGIIVMEGTAIGSGGNVDENTCGTVSAGVGTTGYPFEFYNESGNINSVLYVHLSSSMCSADLNIAIHEFGHALGLGAHFEGFGIGPSIDDNFWNVLYNIYNNNVGAEENSLTITPIYF